MKVVSRGDLRASFPVQLRASEPQTYSFSRNSQSHEPASGHAPHSVQSGTSAKSARSRVQQILPRTAGYASVTGNKVIGCVHSKPLTAYRTSHAPSYSRTVLSMPIRESHFVWQVLSAIYSLKRTRLKFLFSSASRFFKKRSSVSPILFSSQSHISRECCCWEHLKSAVRPRARAQRRDRFDIYISV